MKRKTTNLVIVLLSFLIAALIALAVFMTWFTKEQTAFLEKSLRDVKNEHSVQDSSDTADTSDHIVSSSCHHFLFVGDSRTVGMEEAMQDSDDADTCSYIGKVGEGYYWLVNEGIDQLRTSLSKEPDATVVFNLGVNDLSEIDRYLAFYPQIFAEYPDASFYIMSVNPVGDACSGASNEEIRDFNAKLKESFPDQYLDCYDYLEQNGFSTVDDLHYTNDTYRAIHDYTVSAISDMENPPEAISDGRLNPATNTSLLPAAYSGSHLPSDIKWQNKHFSLFCHFCIKRTFAIRFSVLSLSEQKLRKHHVT